MVMEDTMDPQPQQGAPAPENRSRALATRRQRQDSALRNIASLEDTPIYASTGVRRVTLGNSGKYWVEFLEELDFGQQTLLDNASVIGVLREQAQQDADAGQTVRLDLTRQRFLLCATYITRWSVPPDRNGREIKWPRHPNDRTETIRHLNPKWGDAIVAIITEHVADKQEEEQAAQDDMDEAAGLVQEEDRDDNPPVPSQNGAHVVDAQSSHSASTPVGLSAN
jgi:hypothetical protein